MRHKRWRTIMIVAVTIAATLIMMIPIYWMVNAAIRPIREVLTVPPKFIPDTVTFDYIKAVLESQRNQQHFRNSFVITISALSLTLFFSTLAAYGFSRFKIPERKSYPFSNACSIDDSTGKFDHSVFQVGKSYEIV